MDLKVFAVRSGKNFSQRLCYRLVLLCLLLLPAAGFAAQEGTERKLDEPLREELTYLLSFVGSEAAGKETFQLDRVSGLIKFAAGAKDPRTLYHAGAYNGAVSAYHELDLHRSLSDILHLTYNPAIPSAVTMPASIRLSHWTAIDPSMQALAELSDPQAESINPQFIRGIEHIVNTPDQHSEAYFEYDLYRTLILTKYEGRPVFISLSRQKGVSDVGKKGVIVGPDDNWDYLYTGQAGISYAGLGWVKSYMYDSYSVSFCIETDPAAPLVRFGVFKWLRAGWAGINLARPVHISSGLERFGEGLQEILENPRLADVNAVSRYFSGIKSLSDEEQRKIIAGYLAEIETKYRREKRLSDGQLDDLFNPARVLDGLSKDERQALIALAYMKSLLGSSPNLELTVLRPKPAK
ncbi:MAG: hypothetical protein WAM73_08150 [Desulfobacterales bacterium]